jgi:hypothetical protein
METKHTPGPWHIAKYENYYGYSISADGVGCIAERWWPCKQDIDLPIEANARLIATAPEMLEALVAFKKVLDNNLVIFPHTRLLGNDVGDPTALEILNAAIRKAEEGK